MLYELHLNKAALLKEKEDCHSHILEYHASEWKGSF